MAANSMKSTVSSNDHDDPKQDARSGANTPGAADATPAGALEGVEPEPQDDEQFIDELKPGTKLFHGQYTIVQFINSGGFGITYLAKDSLDRTVVIKECFPGSFCRRSSTIVRARSRAHQNDFRSIVRLFVQEARSLSKLVHPNIVGVHQVFEDNDTAYMAIDYVNGRDLLTVIEQGEIKLTPDNIFNLLKKLLEAISFIHGSGVLHRDISPDNILVNEKLDPVLIDFGAARELASKQSRALSALRVVKDGYSPQEFYIAGSVQADSSDLYALAASFYHVITGEPPPNSQFRLSAIAEGEGDTYEPLAGRFDGYPVGFLEAIDKAVNVLPRDRIVSAASWLELIEQGRRVSEAEGGDVTAGSIESTLARLLAEETAHEPVTLAQPATPLETTPPDIERAPGPVLSAEPHPVAPLTTPSRAEKAPRKSGGRLVLLGTAAAIALFAGYFVLSSSPGDPAMTAPVPEMLALVEPVEPVTKLAAAASVDEPIMGAVAPEVAAPEVAADEVGSLEVIAPLIEEPIAVSDLPATDKAQAEAETAQAETEATQIESEAIAPALDMASEPAPDKIAAIDTDAAATEVLATDVVAEAVAVAPGVEPVAPPEVVPSELVQPEAAIPESGDSPDVELAAALPEPEAEVADSAAEAVEATHERDPAVLPEQVSTASWSYNLPFQTLPVRVSGDPFPVVIGISGDAAKMGANPWLAEGVTIYSVNDEWVSDQASIMGVVAKNPARGENHLVSARARIKASDSAQFEVVTLALATVREVELLNGTTVRAQLRDGVWETMVIATEDAPATGLLPGDIVMSEHQSGLSVETPLSFEEIVGFLAAEQHSQAFFTVSRDGESVIATSDLMRGE